MGGMPPTSMPPQTMQSVGGGPPLAMAGQYMPNVSRPQMTGVANPPVVADKIQYQKRSAADKTAVKYTGFLPLEGVYEEDTCRIGGSLQFLHSLPGASLYACALLRGPFPISIPGLLLCAA